ncbi:hypothetical protein DYBT9623_01575 [Dyadobacter sp. CECT 9623]|uniref:Uncharacterized protein n=1 Tax=Dyadobacter linearis TaxID=2823330 RepID=A0ABN7R6N2_9BACT|nr:hypothetical protein [Dyadobacter sp. CECT 9623]CAG5068843.1 hypothetical protein DYBT9623_01575 [Dyadobacter sp. CECT 9623]
MEAILKVHPAEFTDELIEKIRLLLRGREDSEITISISERPSSGILRKESSSEYFDRLEKSLKNLEERNMVTFSGDSLELFTKHLEQGR